MGSILLLTALAFAAPIRFGGSGGSAVTGMAVDKDGNVCVAGGTTSFDFPTRNAFQTANTGTRLSVTRDSGRSWKPVSNLPGVANGFFVIGAVAFDPTNPQILYVGTSNALMKSTDGGSSFTTLPAILSPPNANSLPTAIAIDPQQPSTIYVGIGPSISKTTDGGKTWATMRQGIPQGQGGAGYLAIDPFHPQTLLAGFNSIDYITHDGAQHWTQQILPDDHRSSGTRFGALFDPFTSGTFYLFNVEGVFVSTDSGATLSKLTVPDQFTHSIAVGSGGVLYAGTDHGIFKSTDRGATWTSIGPAGAGTIARIYVDPNDPKVLVAGPFFSSDGGVTFGPLSLGREPSLLSFAPGASGLAYAISVATSDAFVAKFSPAGDMLFATYLGGEGDDVVSGLALDPAGNIYVSGSTTSTDFPLTANAYKRTPTNAFAAKISPDGKLLWSSYLDQDANAKLAVDPSGALYVLANFSQFVQKISADGTTSVYKTSIAAGSSSSSSFTPTGIAVDRSGNATVAGVTSSTTFPTTQGALQPKFGGNRDGFVMRLDPTGGVIYATYLGGADRDEADAVALDGDGNAYILGNTASKNFPVSGGAYQSTLHSNCAYPAFGFATGLIGTIFDNSTDDLFVTKLSPSGALIYSTYLGGDCFDQPSSIAVDAAGNAWVAGRTDSNPFPVAAPFETGPAENSFVGTYKSIVAKLDPTGSILLRSSYVNAGDRPVVATGAGGTYIGGTFGPLTFGDSGPPAPPQPPTTKAQIQRIPEETAPVTIQSIGNSYLLQIGHLLNGPVTAGEIVTIQADGVTPASSIDLRFDAKGGLPTVLNGVRVLFDGIAAPVMAVSPGHVTAVTPMSLSGASSTDVQVEFQGVLSTPVTSQVVPVDPALLPLDSSTANARNEDGTQNSVANPAPAGSAVTLFFTGGGATTPAPADGSITVGNPPVPVKAVLLQIGPKFANAIELSAVPGFVAGLLKIKVKLPDGVTGDHVPVIVNTQGNLIANSPSLTISIR